MKKVIFLAVLIPYFTFGQIVENFESGTIVDWTQSSPDRWKADTTARLSGVYSLHHIFDNPATGADQTGIALKNIHPSEGITRWSFSVKYGYDPSSSNNWSVFLFSDSEPALMSADGTSSGFVIGVNLTGLDDTLRLSKVNGSEVTTVVNCRINWQTEVGMNQSARIIVERSPDGIWKVDVYGSNGDLLSQSSGSDNELFNIGWFGILYRYTSTKDRLFWFDDLNIEGVFYEDNEPPSVTECKVTGKNSLLLSFNEQPLEENMNPENFSLNSAEIKCFSIEMVTEFIYRIEFDGFFINKALDSLLINQICDKRGNCSLNIQLPLTPVWAEAGDVAITEIMADPLPVVSLPGREYIEIYNRTAFQYNLKDWILRYGDQDIILDERTIGPSEFIILCSKSDTATFKRFGNVLGLKQFPSLTDGGGLLCLSDSLNSLVHGIEYYSEWYQDELKSGGGWSLEMIDTGYPFYYRNNWKASRSRTGGTPGYVNSVSGINPDVEFSGIQYVFAEDSVSVLINFSEPILNLSEQMDNISIEGKNVTGLYSNDPLFREFILRPSDDLQRGKEYSVDISELEDFSGNGIQRSNFIFGLTEPCSPGDLLFNELLFNPFPGDPDYMEIFNGSEKIIDASRLQVVSVNTSGDTSQVVSLSGSPLCIMSGSYFAITTDRSKILERYYSANPAYLYENQSIPSMTDDEGHLILYNRELDKIDEVSYNKGMHYSLIKDPEGVALEKISPGNTSEEKSNWHSASESAGWGTPGAPNSILSENKQNSDIVAFSSTKITADSDGYEDFLSIHLSLTGNGNVITILIFDESGNFIRKIASNMLLGPDESLTWDGTADDGSPVETGIYVVLIKLYDDTGKTRSWKKACTVIRN